MRIVSLVPSITETLFHFGLEESVVGITRFCVHPADKLKTIAKVGGTKTVNIDKVLALGPDLVIANKEENTKEQIEALQKSVWVWITDINTIPDALEFLSELGKITATENRAAALVREIQSAIPPKINKIKPSALYFIWQNPLMVAGKNTFISEMMKFAGFSNAAGRLNGRYPEIAESQIKSLNPEYILLSSEPYPFGNKHLEYFERIFPVSSVLPVDGEMFSWYGSRMTKAIKYFEELSASLQKD